MGNFGEQLWPRSLSAISTKVAADRTRIITARGRNIGMVAAARRPLTLLNYGLRDEQIRALAAGAA